MAGEELPFTLKLVSPCTLRVALSWEILLDGKAFEQGRFIAGATETRLDLRALTAGTHQIEATASWSDVSVSHWSQELEVSAQPGP
jgi:hypothetical protein